MTLVDIYRQNRGFIDFFGDFGLRHTFQERIASKSLQIDLYNLHMNFLTLNVDLNGPCIEPIVQRGLRMMASKMGTP